MYKYMYMNIYVCAYIYIYIYVYIYLYAQRLVTSPRHHDLLNAITYLMCSMLKEDVQTCNDALCMH